MRKQLLVSFFVSMLMFCVFVPQSSEALLVNPGVFYTVDNGNYTVSAPMVFSQIKSMPGPGSHWITFNDSGFNLTSASTINVSLVYIDDDVVSAPVGTAVLRFYANSTADASTRFFNVSGFRPLSTYSLFKDGVFDANIVSTAAGSINFSHVFNAATHLFELVNDTIVIPLVGGGGGDSVGSGVYFVTIHVVDNMTRVPLSGAMVTLEGVSVRWTDDNGEVVFYFLLGTYYPYTLRVSAKGYVDVSWSVRFNDSQKLTVNMSLVSNGHKGIPGFEFVFMMAGAAVLVILLRKKGVVREK